MATETSVEAFLRDNRSALDNALDQLAQYFQAKDHHAALRLAVLGLASANGDRARWLEVTTRFTELFHQTDIDPKINERTIQRFALGTHKARNKHLEAYLALYAFHQLELEPDLLSRPMLAEAFAVGDTLERARNYLKSDQRGKLNRKTQNSSPKTVIKSRIQIIAYSTLVIQALEEALAGC